MMTGTRGGGGRRQERQALMVAFAVALLMGTAVYFRIWARQSDDPSFTADDREELRQFEHANLEAMDESAEWRMKYDTELGKNRELQDELLKVKTSLSASAKRFDSLQKDNEMLKRQIESMKLQCNCTVPLNITQE